MKLTTYLPACRDLWFKQRMMADGDTMSYNHAFGGTIPFPEEKWPAWYAKWIMPHFGRRYYRYLADETGAFVGEIAYYFDDDTGRYMANVVIYAPYRGKGYGKKGLEMLCDAAKEQGIDVLYDEIAIDNPAIGMFLKQGFEEVCRTEQAIEVRKFLRISHQEKKMFREIRNKANETGRERAKELLIRARRGVLAVNGDDGYPYAMPVNYLYDSEEGKIYFHGAREGHRIDSLKKSDKVCFTVYGAPVVKYEEWAPFVENAVAFGRCRMLEDGEKALDFLRRFAMKYFPTEEMVDEEIARGGASAQVFEIEIEHLSAKEIQEK